MYHRDLLGRDTTGTRLDRLQGRVTAVTFSPDGRFALAASAKDQGSDDGVCIWDVETRRLIRYWCGTFRGHVLCCLLE